MDTQFRLSMEKDEHRMLLAIAKDRRAPAAQLIREWIRKEYAKLEAKAKR